MGGAVFLMRREWFGEVVKIWEWETQWCSTLDFDWTWK